MADYLVASGGSNTAPYDTWAKAATSLQTALTAANTNGDRVIIQYDAIPSGDAELSVDTTYTIGSNIAIIASTNSGTSTITPTAMGVANWIGNSTINKSITFTGAFSVFMYGLTLRTAGTTSDSINVGGSGDGVHYELEDCYFYHENTGTSSVIQLGSRGLNNTNAYIKLINTTFQLSNTSQSINISGQVDIVGGSISSSGSAPSAIFRAVGSDPGGASLKAIGFDASHAGSGYLVDDSTTISFVAKFTGCKLGTSFVPLAPQTNTNKSSAQVWIFDSSSSDQHYHLGYSDALGDLTMSTGIYANAGAKYDGTNGYSWKIVTSAAASYYIPFVTPWIEQYHSATSAITPYIEILRDGSATAYQDDEVWAEFGAKTTTGSTLMSFSNDRMALAGTPANQTASSLGASDWTGENATAWFGKCVAPASVTPAEIGMLMARVIVGEPSITVYADPTIRT